MKLKLYPKNKPSKFGKQSWTTLNLIALLDNEGKHLKFLPHSPWLIDFIAHHEIDIPDDQYQKLVDNYKIREYNQSSEHHSDVCTLLPSKSRKKRLANPGLF
jgi:hypothetical protein